MIVIKQELKGKLNNPTVTEYPNLDEKTVTPTIEEQEILPTFPYYGMSKVTVEGVTNEIDPNIQASNIKRGVEILGVEGVLDEGLDTSDATAESTDILQGKTAYANGEKIEGTIVNQGLLQVTPLIEEQTIQQGYYEGGTIEAVTSSIDSNILPTNIRAGVSILGVNGNLEPDKPDQEKTVTPSEETQEVMADTGYELAKVTVEGIETENITVKSGLETETVLASEGKYIKQVEIEPIVLQNKTITPTEYEIEVSKDADYDGLDKVIIHAIETENKTVKSGLEEKIVRNTEGKFIKQITVEPIELQNKTITPTEYEIEVSKDADYDGLDKVIIHAIETENKTIKSGLEEKIVRNTEGKFIKQITVEPIELQNKIVTPTTANQTIEADEEYDGLGNVTVNAVTSEIDANIQPENIKQGVEILGVEGTMQEGEEVTEEVDDQIAIINQLQQQVNNKAGISAMSATATASDIALGKTAYARGEMITGTATLSSSTPDWEEIGYDEVPQIVMQSFQMAKDIYENWDSTNTTLSRGTLGIETTFNSLIIFPAIDTSNIENMNETFRSCTYLKEIPELDASSVVSFDRTFMSTTGLTNFGGLKNIGQAYTERITEYENYCIDLVWGPNLTHDSLMNIINNLYDLNLNENLAVDGICQYPQKIILSPNAIDKLTEQEIAIATAKGWNIESAF